MEIIVYFNPEWMIDGWEQDDIDSLDWDASVQKYVDLYHAAITRAYPEAEVSVTADHRREPEVWNSDYDHRINEDVLSIGGDVYVPQEWIVLNDVPAPAV